MFDATPKRKALYLRRWGDKTFRALVPVFVGGILAAAVGDAFLLFDLVLLPLLS